jgi:hypothetical protein
VAARSYVVRTWHPQLDGNEASSRRTIEVGSPRTGDSFTLPLESPARVRPAPTCIAGELLAQTRAARGDAIRGR